MSTAPELVFDPASHAYTVGGERWPSVTQVLSVLGEYEAVDPTRLQAAAAFGTHVHEAVHLLNCGTLDRAALDPALEPCVAAWERFLVETGARVVASELRVAHASLRYAGTLDCIVRIGGRRELVDLKSTASIPRTVGPQTAAYAAALGEPRIRRRVVQVRRDGSYRAEVLASSTDFALFTSCLNVWNFRNRT